MGEGRGEKRESVEKGKVPLPLLPNPTPFFPSSLRPYPFQRLLTGYPTNVCWIEWFPSHCSQISAGAQVQIIGEPIGAVEVKVLTSQTHTYKLGKALQGFSSGQEYLGDKCNAWMVSFRHDSCSWGVHSERIHYVLLKYVSRVYRYFEKGCRKKRKRQSLKVLCVFTWRHGGHICVSKQWNGGHVCVFKNCRYNTIICFQLIPFSKRQNLPTRLN